MPRAQDKTALFGILGVTLGLLAVSNV